MRLRRAEREAGDFGTEIQVEFHEGRGARGWARRRVPICNFLLLRGCPFGSSPESLPHPLCRVLLPIPPSPPIHSNYLLRLRTTPRRCVWCPPVYSYSSSGLFYGWQIPALERYAHRWDACARVCAFLLGSVVVGRGGGFFYSRLKAQSIAFDEL